MDDLIHEWMNGPMYVWMNELMNEWMEMRWGVSPPHLLTPLCAQAAFWTVTARRWSCRRPATCPSVQDLGCVWAKHWQRWSSSSSCPGSCSASASPSHHSVSCPVWRASLEWCCSPSSTRWLPLPGPGGRWRSCELLSNLTEWDSGARHPTMSSTNRQSRFWCGTFLVLYSVAIPRKGRIDTRYYYIARWIIPEDCQRESSHPSRGRTCSI